jgi:nucleoid-associated protein YgaU
MAKLIRVDRNGTKYYEGYVPCSRCGGAGGSDAWAYTGWTCYKCGGSGKEWDSWKEYTPEYEAKLEARREARRQKYLEEHKAEIEAREAEKKRQQEEAEAQRLAEEARIKAEKALSNLIGKVGDKIDTTATYIKTAWFEIPSFKGYGTDTMYIHTFKIGNDTVVWKTTATLGRWNDKDEWESYEEGQEVHLKGTIKELNEYKDEKQTVLTRCRIK